MEHQPVDKQSIDRVVARLIELALANVDTTKQIAEAFNTKEDKQDEQET